MLGIYIHIPFCKKRCFYCDFCSTANFTDKMMDGYLRTLIEQIGEYFEGKTQKADTIYIGGGTPSVFGGKRIERLIKELRKRVDIAKNAEITVEVNPESCDRDFCKWMAKAGVNRVSLGIQSSNDRELKAIGRLHTFEKAKEAVVNVQKYLTGNVSLDLMYGLPFQTMESFEKSIEDVVSLNPSHISAYGLKLEEGSLMYNMNIDLPDDDEQADMYLLAVDKLDRFGYRQYEISNFAKNNAVSKHNSKYWDLTEYIGLGAGAHSLYGGKRFSFKSNIENYSKGIIEIEEIEDLSLEKKYRKGEYVMLALRTVKGLSEDEYYSIFKESMSNIESVLERYIEPGFCRKDGRRYYLAPKGFLISNKIIGDVLDILGDT